jgi:hypothetical protein
MIAGLSWRTRLPSRLSFSSRRIAGRRPRCELQDPWCSQGLRYAMTLCGIRRMICRGVLVMWYPLSSILFLALPSMVVARLASEQPVASEAHEEEWATPRPCPMLAYMSESSHRLTSGLWPKS